MSNTFKISFTLTVFLLLALHITWDYFHGGIPTHYFLHSDDYPGIPNWWGLISLPLVTWFLLSRIKLDVDDEKNRQLILRRFLAGLIYGILIAFLFTIDSAYTGIVTLGMLSLSILFPIYRSEYVLGFLIGMSYTFGANLPLIFGALFSLIGFIGYKGIRGGFLYLFSKLNTAK